MRLTAAASDALQNAPVMLGVCPHGVFAALVILFGHIGWVHRKNNASQALVALRLPRRCLPYLFLEES